MPNFGRRFDFFEGYPFDDAELARADYERQEAPNHPICIASPPPALLGDEMIYHFIMREVAEITTNIALSPAFIVPARMIPGGHILPSLLGLGYRYPGLIGSQIQEKVWSGREKHLRSIVEGDGWMLITWQVTRHHYNLSLH